MPPGTAGDTRLSSAARRAQEGFWQDLLACAKIFLKELESGRYDLPDRAVRNVFGFSGYDTREDKVERLAMLMAELIWGVEEVNAEKAEKPNQKGKSLLNDISFEESLRKGDMRMFFFRLRGELLDHALNKRDTWSNSPFHAYHRHMCKVLRKAPPETGARYETLADNLFFSFGNGGDMVTPTSAWQDRDFRTWPPPPGGTRPGSSPLPAAREALLEVARHFWRQTCRDMGGEYLVPVRECVRFATHWFRLPAEMETQAKSDGKNRPSEPAPARAADRANFRDPEAEPRETDLFDADIGADTPEPASGFLSTQSTGNLRQRMVDALRKAGTPPARLVYRKYGAYYSFADGPFRPLPNVGQEEIEPRDFPPSPAIHARIAETESRRGRNPDGSLQGAAAISRREIMLLLAEFFWKGVGKEGFFLYVRQLVRYIDSWFQLRSLSMEETPLDMADVPPDPLDEDVPRPISARTKRLLAELAKDVANACTPVQLRIFHKKFGLDLKDVDIAAQEGFKSSASIKQHLNRIVSIIKEQMVWKGLTPDDLEEEERRQFYENLLEHCKNTLRDGMSGHDSNTPSGGTPT
ncbi:hypothetical protein JCM15519_10170 [Fundidesulfovibrio butyratiphilus]